ncbi:hypothetical protein [Amycolatopsis jejuensis]|uniref:hypothetical protein n=1 Tax=Amycolatopsis jejuensis TaxID=330084 RepID=UPI000525A365|nr:hypothetical protein [Amycolatopsis jejuensis]
MAEKDEFDGLTDDERRKRGRAPDPVLPGQVPAKAKPPATVHVAFLLAIFAALVILAQQVLIIALKQQLVDNAVKQTQQAGKPVDLAQLQSGATTLVWAMFIGALCFSALFVLFAWKAREGTRSARTIVTLLAAIGLIYELALVRTPYFAQASSLALVAMLVLLYLPRTAEYFPKVGKRL